jgi:predicted PurR-regulated permease PerM
VEEREERPWFPGGERVASFLGLLLILYAAYRLVRPVLLVLLIAAAIASLTHGWYLRVAWWLGRRRRLGAAVMVVLLLLGVLGPLATAAVLAGERLVVETIQLAQHLRADGRSVERLARAAGPLGPLVRRVAAQIEPAISAAVPALVRRATEVLGVVGTALLRMGVALFLGAIALYYLYLDGPTWRERLVRLLPIAPADARTFLARFRQVSLGVLVGNLGTALAQGLLATLGFFLFGVPLPLLWGLVTAAAAFIPAVGTLLVLGPITVYLFFAHGWLRALGFGLYAALVIGTVDNFLRPLLTRTALPIHPLAMFVAVIGGVASFGLAGVFLGPLVMALAITVLDLHERRSGAAG